MGDSGGSHPKVAQKLVVLVVPGGKKVARGSAKKAPRWPIHRGVGVRGTDSSPRGKRVKFHKLDSLSMEGRKSGRKSTTFPPPPALPTGEREAAFSNTALVGFLVIEVRLRHLILEFVVNPSLIGDDDRNKRQCHSQHDLQCKGTRRRIEDRHAESRIDARW